MEGKQVAYIIAQSVAAMARIESMKIANHVRDAHGYAPMYGEEAFEAVINDFNLGHNAVVGTLGENW